MQPFRRIKDSFRGIMLNIQYVVSHNAVISTAITRELLLRRVDSFSRVETKQLVKVTPQYCIAHPYCARFLRH